MKEKLPIRLNKYPFLATDFACLKFRFSLDMRTGCLKLDWAEIFIDSFNIKLL